MIAHHATIKLLYAVDCNDHGNELVSQEAMTRITFFMSWYCTARMTAKRKCEIAPPNNQHFLSDCWSDHDDCKGAEAPVIKNVHDRHRRECNGQKYVMSKGSDDDERWLIATKARVPSNNQPNF
jgi:hypothetical protein